METIGTRPVSRVALALSERLALVAAACSTPPAASAPASVAGPERGGGSPAGSPSAAAGTKHVAIVNKDMTDDEIKAAIAAEGSARRRRTGPTRPTTSWSSSSRQYVKDTYGADVKLTYEGIAGAEHLPDQARRGQGRRQPGAVRRHGDRGELLGRGDRPGPGRRRVPVGPDPERVEGARHLQARPDVDRVPVDRLPGRRLQQGHAPADDEAHGPRRPGAQGQGRPAAARRHHHRRLLPGPCLRARARTTRTRPR